jgi:hypothetical protein
METSFSNCSAVLVLLRKNPNSSSYRFSLDEEDNLYYEENTCNTHLTIIEKTCLSLPPIV